MKPDREHLVAEIAEAQARLEAIERDREAARARLESLTRELADIPPAAARVPGTAVSEPAPSLGPVEKVRLFRRLFRGRDDVFPRLWVNPKKDRKGYAPACFNEWVRGVCGKPRIKCGECPNQAFIPVGDQVVLDHLQGRHVVGVYPLLEDETCWLLAADFDKASWQDDVAALVETCHETGVPVAVERSRSGNGAHAWFFFTAPVPAHTARKMACHLITQTMARRHQVGLDSYDRLFPNQDTLPRGGFGNLIALPLQHGPRQQGNTIFLDESFEPHHDQWAFLESVGVMEPAAVETVAREATRRGQVIGVRFAEPVEEGESEPWTRPPSGAPRRLRIPGPLPSEVHAVLAQRLFVETAGVPSALLNEIKRLAAFQNPEFYAKQKMRLSTALTPRVIACAEEFAQHVAIPRGCRMELESLLRAYGVVLTVDDRREEGESIEVRFNGDLTAVQAAAARALLSEDIGVFVAPPGIGKTVLGTYVTAARGRSTLVLVHRRPLLDQWITQVAMFLGLEQKEVGQIGSGKRKANGRLDVAMIQSLSRKGEIDDIVASYGHVIVDECHHVPAVSFEQVLSAVKARYVLGLTATPRRRDGRHPILEMQLGPVRFSVEPRSQAARRPFQHRLIARETAFRAGEGIEQGGIQQLYRALGADQSRNDLIFDDVLRAIEEGRSPVLLTERRDHVEQFAARLQKFVRHLIVLHGGMTPKQRRELSARVAQIPDHEERLVIATGRYIGEGFDDARLDTMFLALPVAWKGTLVQYTGRLHRLHPNKREVRIYDYVDVHVPILLRMFEKRMRGYRAIGYARGEARLGYGLPVEESRLEYDEAAPSQIGSEDI